MKNGVERLRTSSGFTVVEVVVSVVIAAVFILIILQLYVAQTKVSSGVLIYNKAELTAYNNLRTYAYGKAPTWFQCTYTSGNPNPMTLLSSSDPVEGLPSPVQQTVVATAPYGCGGGASGIGYPIKVVSTVTYGASAQTVVHATYSTY